MEGLDTSARNERESSNLSPSTKFSYEARWWNGIHSGLKIRRLRD